MKIEEARDRKFEPLVESPSSQIQPSAGLAWGPIEGPIGAQEAAA